MSYTIPPAPPLPSLPPRPTPTASTNPKVSLKKALISRHKEFQDQLQQNLTKEEEGESKKSQEQLEREAQQYYHKMDSNTTGDEKNGNEISS